MLIYQLKLLSTFAVALHLNLLKPNATSLCQYSTFWTGSMMSADQVFILISLKRIMEGSKNGMTVIPVKIFSRLRVNSIQNCQSTFQDLYKTEMVLEGKMTYFNTYVIGFTYLLLRLN